MNRVRGGVLVGSVVLLIAAPVAYGQTAKPTGDEVTADIEADVVSEFFIQKDGHVIEREKSEQGWGKWRYRYQNGDRLLAKLGRLKETGEAFWVFEAAKNNPRRAPQYDDPNRVNVQPDVEPRDVARTQLPRPAERDAPDDRASRQVSAPTDLTGIWESNYGSVRIIQEGDTLQGVITYRNGNQGQWEGTLTGDTIDFTYRNSSDHGTGKMRVMQGGRIIDGYFIEQTGKQGSWYMERSPSRR